MTQAEVRLLVVGGSGFIGRHIVDRAAQLGWAVTSLGLSRQSDRGHAASGVRHLTVDIADRERLQAALGEASFEYVVNCGGYIDHVSLFRGGRTLIDTHFGGLLNLVEILNRDVLRAFLNIGSSDEYGNVPAPQSETQREAPISPYSAAKTGATHFLQMLHRAESFPSTTLRLFLTYGPGQDERRFLPQIIRGCLDGRSFPASAGTQLRDFCFIDDTTDAVFAALRTPAAKGEIINVGSGEPVSIREMIEAVRTIVGRGTPEFGAVPFRPGENMALFADISKAKALLEWTPKTTLDAGIRKTIEWIVNQK